MAKKHTAAGRGLPSAYRCCLLCSRLDSNQRSLECNSSIQTQLNGRSIGVTIAYPASPYWVGFVPVGGFEPPSPPYERGARNHLRYTDIIRAAAGFEPTSSLFLHAIVAHRSYKAIYPVESIPLWFGRESNPVI